jgi:hypothetical protein
VAASLSLHKRGNFLGGTLEKGLFQKYEVKKLSNPDKNLDCIVLEFDDPIARVAIQAWAEEMLGKGHRQVYEDVMKKLTIYNLTEE